MSAPTPSPVRVLLVDDSELVRRGAAAVLAAHGGSLISVVGEADSVASAVSECARLKPDVVLLDTQLPDGTVSEACRRILERLPRLPILMLSSFSSDAQVFEAIAAGAQGYLTNEVAPASLIQGILDLAQGKSILDPEATRRVMQLLRRQKAPPAANSLDSLSPQERRVLALVAEGKTNKEIGAQLGLSGNTVKNYLGSVFEKLEVRRRSQAAAAFLKSQPPRS